MKRFCQFQTLKHRSQIYAQTCPCTRPRHIDTCSVTIIAFNRRPCIPHSCHQILKYLRKQRLWCKRILQRKYQEAFSAHLCTKQMSLFFFAKKETSSARGFENRRRISPRRPLLPAVRHCDTRSARRRCPPASPAASESSGSFLRQAAQPCSAESCPLQRSGR